MASKSDDSILGWFLNRGQTTAIKSRSLRTTNPLTNYFYGWTQDPDNFDPSDDGLLRAYLASLWSYRCITLRANKLGSIPLHVKTVDGQFVDRKGNTQDTPITSRVNQHIIQRLIGQGTRRMWRAIESDRCIFGRGFIEMGREGLNRLNPYTVEIEKDYTGIQLFRQRVGGEVTHEWKPKDIVYLFDYDPQDDLGSLSPLMFALRAVGSEASLGDFVQAYFANDATPSGMLTSDQNLGESDIQSATSWWNKLFGGAQNKGKVGIVGGGLHYERIQSELENMAIPELRLEVRREVTAAFGVPMTIAGADEAANFSTSKEQHIAFYTETIIPQLETVVDALNEQLVPLFDSKGELVIAADLSGIEVLQEAKTETSTRLQQGFTAGVYSFNEVRELEGLPTQDVDYINVPGIGLVKVDDLPKIAAANISKVALDVQTSAAATEAAAPDDSNSSDTGSAPETPPDDSGPQSPADDSNKPKTPKPPKLGVGREGVTGVGTPLSNAPPKPKGIPKTRLTSHRAMGITDARYGKAVDLGGAPAAYVTVPLDDNPDLVELQNRLKAELGGDDAGEWQYPMHLTLVYAPSIDEDRYNALIKDVEPRSVTICGTHLGIFPDNGEGRVLHLAVAPTPEIMSYQRAIYDAFQAVGVDVSPYSEPEAYTPHITLCYLAPNTSVPDEQLSLELPASTLDFGRDNYQTDTAKTASKRALLTPKAPANLTRTVALAEIKKWEKKVKAKGVKANFETLGIPSAVKTWLKWDLQAATSDDEIKAAFDRAESVIKSEDPTPEEFNAYWKGIDDHATDLEKAVAAVLEDPDLKQRFADHLAQTADPESIPAFFAAETDRMVDALAGTADKPGPLAKIYIAGAARGQELADKLQAKGEKLANSSSKGLITTAWDIVHKQAMSFARSYAFDLVKGMNDTTATAFKDGMSAWVKQGGALPQLIDFLMGRLKGLDVPKGWSSKKIEWATSRDRARLIAQTESTRAFTEGNVARWQQLGIKSIKWRTQNDRIVCPACKDLNNTVAVVGKGFAVPVKHQVKYGAFVQRPPLHSGCRCFPAPVTINPAKPLETISVDPKVSKKQPGDIAIGEKGT